VDVAASARAKNANANVAKDCSTAIGAAVLMATQEGVVKSPRRAGGLNPQDVTWW
jgi:hypothetical protein